MQTLYGVSSRTVVVKNSGGCKTVRHVYIILKRNTSKDSFGLVNWVNLSLRRKMHKCILVYKCVNNMVSGYLCSYFLGNSNFQSHNTRRYDHLPKPNRNLGKRTFRFSARTVCFNTLPSQIKDSSSINIFKHFIFNHFHSGLLEPNCNSS